MVTFAGITTSSNVAFETGYVLVPGTVPLLQYAGVSQSPPEVGPIQVTVDGTVLSSKRSSKNHWRSLALVARSCRCRERLLRSDRVDADRRNLSNCIGRHSYV